MHSKAKKLFREESLERMTSPEQLDQRIQVVNSRAWLSLVAMGGMLVAGLLWSVLGRIPLAVSGQGILIRPSQVVQFQTPGSGQVIEVKVQVGDVVQRGHVLATIDQADLRQQLEQEQNRLRVLQSQGNDTGVLQTRRVDTELQVINAQRQTLQQNLRNAQALTPILQTKELESIRLDRQGLQSNLQDINALLPTLEERLNSRRRLLEQQIITSDAVLQAEQEYLSNLARISELESQLKQLDVREANAQREYLQNLSSIEEIRNSLRDLESRETSISQQSLDATFNRDNQIKEVSNRVAQLNLQIARQGQVLSEYSGRVLEVAVLPGQILSAGSRMGTIEAENSDAQLVGVTYFPIQDGKRIREGMQIQITPSVVKRERFGGILGEVTSVSAFPVSTQGMASLVGNEELVQTLAASGPQIQVNSTLTADSTTYSTYKWSSSLGPPLKIEPGTTTQVRVKIGEVAPISYVIPILRSLTGIY